MERKQKEIALQRLGEANSRRKYNANFILFALFSLTILALCSVSSLALDVTLSDQGTDVTNKTSGSLLEIGTLNVAIWDAASGGTLVYNETFANAIANGSWNVMLGENGSNPLQLEQGKTYYKDYEINGENLNYTNLTGGVVDRVFFQAPTGPIKYSNYDENLTVNGYVGIGTATPTSALHVIGDGNFSGILYASTVSSNSPLQLQTQGTTRIFINDSTGYVGIGTTSLTEPLDVNGNTRILDGELKISDSTNGLIRFVNNGLRNFGLNVSSTSDYSFSFANQASGDISVGIGTITPSAALDVEVSSGGAATIGSSGNSATGNSAVAMGDSTTASGHNSTAMGGETIASGDYSTTMGYQTNASGTYSTAMGYQTTAINTSSTAMGYQTTASGLRSTAMGDNTKASGTYSTAMGWYSRAEYTGSTAMGLASRAEGYGSTAMGDSTNASGSYSTAMGKDTTASGNYATAMGRQTTASGLYAFAAGYQSIANASYAVAIGRSNNAYAEASVAIGQFNTVRAEKGVAIGASNTAGDYALAMGFSSDAMGSDSVAIGTNANASGHRSFATGTGAVAIADDSFVWGGDSCSSSGNCNNTWPGVFAIYGGLCVDNPGGAGCPDVADGNIVADGSITQNAFDIAERINSIQELEAGETVVIDAKNKEQIVRSTKSFDPLVAGIISTKPGNILGWENTGNSLLALAGRVPVKVCTENGAISIGDSLTTSSTEGHGMKWSLLDVREATDFDDMKEVLYENSQRRNAILGKALEEFDGSSPDYVNERGEGCGKIMVLVSLQ